MTLDRRTFVSLAATSALIAPSLALAAEVDLSDLATPPELGEKALGKADAPVTVIEYASATCPHCAHFHAQTYPELKKLYIDTGKVRFVFREFPFDQLALAAFMLARCAPDDKFFAFIDTLFARQKDWVKRQGAREALLAISKSAGFTEETFNACLKDEKVARGIIAIQRKGAEKYGVDSTPTFFINGKLLKGAQDLSDFRKMIDAELG